MTGEGLADAVWEVARLVGSAIIGYVIGKKAARRQAQYSVDQRRASELYPTILSNLGLLSDRLENQLFPRPVFTAPRNRSARLAGRTLHFIWWLDLKREGKDELLPNAVRASLYRLEEEAREFEKAADRAMSVVLQDLRQRMQGAIPPEALDAAEYIIMGVNPESSETPLYGVDINAVKESARALQVSTPGEN